MIEMGEKFCMDLYGKLGKKVDSLDHVREIMYTLPKYIPISRMPPPVGRVDSICSVRI